MKTTTTPLLILIAGPYRSGTNDKPELIAANLRAMNEAALAVYELGHIPVVGEWFALPLVETAGSTKLGDEIFNKIFHPIAWSVAQRCDACLRIAGLSQGADDMVTLAQSLEQPVFFQLADIPTLIQ